MERGIVSAGSEPKVQQIILITVKFLNDNTLNYNNLVMNEYLCRKRLSCHDSDYNEVRLRLFCMARYVEPAETLLKLK